MEPQKQKRIGINGLDGSWTSTTDSRDGDVLHWTGGQSARVEQGTAAFARILTGIHLQVAKMDDDYCRGSDSRCSNNLHFQQEEGICTLQDYINLILLSSFLSYYIYVF